MKRSLIRLCFAASILIALGAVLWLARPGRAAFQPPIPHPLDGRDNCLACHKDGLAGAPKVPSDHIGRTNEMCRGCHQPAAATEPSTTASSASSEAAPVTGNPTQIAHPQAQGGANSCVDCHQGQDKTKQVVADWQSSIHAERKVGCADCHGGDPNASDMAAAMSSSAGFIGKIDREKIPEVCGSCHANVDLMRQYNLPTDQYAQYNESFHGQQLATGDTKVATCFDCHGGHAVRAPNDPRSSVYRLNVPLLCGKCHADEQYMAGYNIPTNQLALYKESVHGIALLQNQDTRAPNCATCHGTHGAAPPGFSEVANVCGGCHSATQDYFLQGKHNSDDTHAPKCVTCHGRYDVQTPSEAMFTGADSRQCGSCHAPGTETSRTVKAIYQQITNANDSLQDAQTTVERARSLGMIVAEEDDLLVNARTKLITARAAQHTIDTATVEKVSNESIQLSTQAKANANNAIEQNTFRRQAMVIAIGVIVVVIGSLVLLRRELATRR